MFPEIRPASFSSKLQTYQSETKTAFKKACQENSLGFCGSRDSYSSPSTYYYYYYYCYFERAPFQTLVL